MAVPIIGLTGGIGSGKSAAAAAFAAHGAAVVDTDAIAHQLTAAGGAALSALAAAFGPTIIAADGALDRAAMRQRVFAEPAERQRLEGILHPLIRRESDRQVAAARTSGVPYVMLMVPLLVESGSYRERVDRIVVVDCAESTQVARVVARNGFSEEQVRAILAAQASRSARLAVADEVVDNDGDLVHLQEQVAQLDRKFRTLAA
ncbi:MAG TPA: dephospho-CoA kinase [Rhodocyclaceae bacterium]|nr:dephospho-CoA kinase [Rhodocyclaceae bacterium]